MVESTMKRHYIYCITNNVNGKQYIGQHVTRLESESEMISDGYMGSGTLLLAAFKKYGRKNFTKKIYYIAQSQQEADWIETEFIKSLKVLENREQWYNRASGGQYNRSERHGEIMSEIMIEVANRPEVKRKISESMARRYGYRNAKEWRDEKEKQKLSGMRTFLINTLKARRNQLNREYLNTEEGAQLKNEYMKECLSEAVRNHNEWQRSPEGRSSMSKAVMPARIRKAMSYKYTPIQLDMLVRIKFATNRDAAKAIGIDETLLGQMRRGMQTMKGKRVPRYVRDDVFNAIQNA